VALLARHLGQFSTIPSHFLPVYSPLTGRRGKLLFPSQLGTTAALAATASLTRYVGHGPGDQPVHRQQALVFDTGAAWASGEQGLEICGGVGTLIR
jgi:hypothetical protein